MGHTIAVTFLLGAKAWEQVWLSRSQRLKSWVQVTPTRSPHSLHLRYKGQLLPPASCARTPVTFGFSSPVPSEYIRHPLPSTLRQLPLQLRHGCRSPCFHPCLLHPSSEETFKSPNSLFLSSKSSKTYLSQKLGIKTMS